MGSGTDDDTAVRGLRRRLWGERVAFVAILGLVLAFHSGKLGGKRVCVIAIDGHPAAVVASRVSANHILDEIKQTSGLPGNVTFSHQVTLHSVAAAGQRVLPDADAMSLLASKLEPVIRAAGIFVNGELVLGLPTRDDAVQTLSLLLKQFSPRFPDVTPAFKEKVKVEDSDLPADRFASSVGAAIERIAKATAPKGSHEVRPGETGWKIALDYHVPLTRLAAANPECDINRIRAGDTLKVPGDMPPLTVIARREVVEDLGPGSSRTVRITYENGVEVSKDVIGRERPPKATAKHRRSKASKDASL